MHKAVASQQKLNRHKAQQYTAHAGEQGVVLFDVRCVCAKIHTYMQIKDAGSTRSRTERGGHKITRAKKEEAPLPLRVCCGVSDIVTSESEATKYAQPSSHYTRVRRLHGLFSALCLCLLSCAAALLGTWALEFLRTYTARQRRRLERTEAHNRIAKKKRHA